MGDATLVALFAVGLVAAVSPDRSRSGRAGRALVWVGVLAPGLAWAFGTLARASSLGPDPTIPLSWPLAVVGVALVVGGALLEPAGRWADLAPAAPQTADAPRAAGPPEPPAPAELASPPHERAPRAVDVGGAAAALDAARAPILALDGRAPSAVLDACARLANHAAIPVAIFAIPPAAVIWPGTPPLRVLHAEQAALWILGRGVDLVVCAGGQADAEGIDLVLEVPSALYVHPPGAIPLVRGVQALRLASPPDGLARRLLELLVGCRVTDRHDPWPGPWPELGGAPTEPGA